MFEHIMNQIPEWTSFLNQPCDIFTYSTKTPTTYNSDVTDLDDSSSYSDSKDEINNNDEFALTQQTMKLIPIQIAQLFDQTTCVKWMQNQTMKKYFVIDHDQEIILTNEQFAGYVSKLFAAHSNVFFYVLKCLSAIRTIVIGISF